MSNGWLDGAEFALAGGLNEKRERLPHERIPCTCGAVSVVAIVRARCCEVVRGVVFGRGSYGHGDDADVGGTKRCERRRKLVLVTDVVSFEQRRKKKVKVGKLSQVNLQVLSWKLAICSIRGQKLPRQPRH
jgi:hypothetical protein